MINSAYLLHSGNKRIVADISRQPYMHPNNVRSSRLITLIFTLCTRPHLPFQTPTLGREKKKIHVHVSAPHTNNSPTIPSHAFPSQKLHPTCGARVSRFTRNNGRLGALQPRKKTTSHKGLGRRGPVHHPGSPKKAFAALAPGILVMGCIRHCALLESNAGTVSWCFDSLNFF